MSLFKRFFILIYFLLLININIITELTKTINNLQKLSTVDTEWQLVTCCHVIDYVLSRDWLCVVTWSM